MTNSKLNLNIQLNRLVNKPYEYGFSTNIETEQIPFGLNKTTVHLISNKKKEPKFMLQFRLRAYKKWGNLICPNWAKLKYPHINYQNIIYYSAPKLKKKSTKYR